VQMAKVLSRYLLRLKISICRKTLLIATEEELQLAINLATQTFIVIVNYLTEGGQNFWRL